MKALARRWAVSRIVHVDKITLADSKRSGLSVKELANLFGLDARGRVLKD